MTWRIPMQCPHGFSLQVPIERIVVVERLYRGDYRRGIEVDAEVCDLHAKESRQLLTREERKEPSWRERRRFDREVRKLEGTLRKRRSQRFR